MAPAIANNEATLAALCERFGVERLEIFGSGATGEEFDPHSSDLDFIVQFRPEQSLGPWLSHYFDFRQSLVDLFGYPVDLVMASAMKNRHFVREANRTRQLLYGR